MITLQFNLINLFIADSIEYLLNVLHPVNGHVQRMGGGQVVQVHGTQHTVGHKLLVL